MGDGVRGGGRGGCAGSGIPWGITAICPTGPPRPAPPACLPSTPLPRAAMETGATDRVSLPSCMLALKPHERTAASCSSLNLQNCLLHVKFGAKNLTSPLKPSFLRTVPPNIL